MAELQDRESKIGSSQGSLTESFDEILPLIYEKIPHQVLLFATDFFENIISERYLGEKNLFDYPSELLYSQHSERFGLNAFYEWYKNKMKEFCSNFIEEAKQLIEKLQQSKWESQKQLSMLCKIRNVSFFRDDILNYIKDVLKSDLNNPDMYKQSELFIRAIERVFEAILPQERDEIINSLLKLELDDELQVREWIWIPLHHIPDLYCDERVIRKLEEIRKKYNFEEYKYKPPIRSSGVQGAQPIVKTEVLRTKNLDELYKFLIENRNLKDKWDSGEDIFYGGVEELAQEAVVVFVEDLEKYKNVIEDLAKESENDIYLELLFSELAKKGVTKNEYIDWLIELINFVYKSGLTPPNWTRN